MTKGAARSWVRYLACGALLLGCEPATTVGDAGRPEAGVVSDAAPAVDAGRSVDAGAQADAGAAVDAGAGRDDAGAGADAGTPRVGEPAIPRPSGACPAITASGDVTLDAAGSPLQAYFDLPEGGVTPGMGLIIAFQQACCSGGEGALTMARVIPGTPEEFVRVGPYKEGRFWSGAPEIADAIVACAFERLPLDPARIHVVGLSAGANAVVDVLANRSSYVASGAVWSAGAEGAPPTAPDHRYAIMTGYGSDSADQPFRDITLRIRDRHADAGHVVIDCPHGMGHRFPYEAGPGVVRFFQDHPWGTRPTPWVSGIPTRSPRVPSYCEVFAAGD